MIDICIDKLAVRKFKIIGTTFSLIFNDDQTLSGNMWTKVDFYLYAEFSWYAKGQ